MKKLIFVLVFLLSTIGLYAGENIFYTLKYPTTFTIVTAFIEKSECLADGKCYCLVSVSYIKKDTIANPDNNISMVLIKVSGFSPAQDPVISFKQDSFVWNIVVDTYTSTQTY
jgi:hypothetical protein